MSSQSRTPSSFGQERLWTDSADLSLRRVNRYLNNFSWFGFYCSSRLFHSFWADSIVRWANTGDHREKPPDHPQTEIGFVWPKLGLNQQWWDDLRFRALKISGLNHLATVATYRWFCLFRYVQTQTELGHEKMCLMSYANNKGVDQPAHPHSLISVFVVRCLNSIIALDSIAEISRL